MTNENLHIDEEGLKFVANFEGCRLTAYDDLQPNKVLKSGDVIKGTLTIGYGHTKDVYIGQTITKDKALQMLKEDFAKDYELRVKRQLKVEVNQTVFNALCSRAYNVGNVINVAKAINNGNHTLALQLMEKPNTSKGIVLKGLTKRRLTEKEMLQRGLSEMIKCNVSAKKKVGDNLEIKTLLSMKSNYGSTRSTSKIKYIVLHYTGNKTDKAVSNANYFKNNKVGASAHYFVDKTEIYQSVPDNYVAWHCGGKKYPNCASTGGGKLYEIVTNANSIGVEMCSDNGQFHKDTLNNAEKLVKYLMKKYNIPVENICMHAHVTGKPCPAYWVKGNGFEQFISRFKTTQEKDDDLFNAVSKIIKFGIKLDFNSWKRKDLILKNIKNVPILLDRLGGLDKLIKDGIISDKTLWEQKKYNVNHVRSLLIKFASKLKQ